MNISAAATRAPGALNGVTILRFAHAYVGGAGLEYDIDAINRALHRRNQVTTVDVRICPRAADEGEAERVEGLGKLVTVTIHRPTDRAEAPGGNNDIDDPIPSQGVVIDRLFGAVARFRRPPWRPTDVPTAPAKIRLLCERYRPDLIVLHSLGGRDSDEIIADANRCGIPVLTQLHFANERYRQFSIRRQAARAAGVSGVSDIRVPTYLRDRYVNLKTGLDITEYVPHTQPAEPPLLVLPGRLVKAKGHLDLVEAVGRLRDRGIHCRAIFPGRTDDPTFVSQLAAAVAARDLRDHIAMPGLLSPPEMRKCYSGAALLAFPTYHFEGLPRAIMEAQAMGIPAVAYDSGGTAGALVDGKSGYVVPRGDLSQLTARLEDLLLAPTLRAEMGLAARKYAENHFSLHALAERHERFYIKCMRCPARDLN